MKKLILLLMFLGALQSESLAGSFGGARASSPSSGRASISSSASRSSSFGGSRAARSAPAPIIRSAPKAPAPVVINNHTSGSGGSGFVTGMVVGGMLAQPHTTVIVPGGGGAGGTAVYADTGSRSELGFVLFLLGGVALILLAVWYMEKKSEG